MMRHLVLTLMTICSFALPAAAAQNVEQLSGEDMKTAIEMNKIYARHMYSSSCVERQRQMFVPKILNAQEKAALMASYQKSCDCLTDGLMESFAPGDVISYITYMNGSVAPGTQKAKPDQQTMQKNAQIMSYARDKQVRNQCGFKQ